MPAIRLPPALQVFPTLSRFPALNPRRLQDIPVGYEARDPSRVDLRRAILHIYHDLGVLVFAGCSFAQTQKIGDVLSQVVTWGGPGGVVAMLDKHTIKYKKEREDDAAVQGADFQEAIEKRRAGILNLEAIYRLSKARLREQVKQRVAEMKPAVKGVRSRETQVLVPGSPPISGAIHQTVHGPRRLPIESWSSVTVQPRSGIVVGEARFFTVGSGEYLGAAQIHYLWFRLNKEKSDFVPFWPHGRIPERTVREKGSMKERMDKVLLRVMMPLWDLEREIWLHQWQAFTEAEREEARKSREASRLQKDQKRQEKEKRKQLQQELEELERTAQEGEAEAEGLEEQQPELLGEQDVQQEQEHGLEKDVEREGDHTQVQGVQKSDITKDHLEDADDTNSDDARRTDRSN